MCAVSSGDNGSMLLLLPSVQERFTRMRARARVNARENGGDKDVNRSVYVCVWVRLPLTTVARAVVLMTLGSPR